MSDRPSETDRGMLVVVSSPSGAGKTTLCRRLVQEFDRVDFSISYTTRPARHTERDGVDYHFVTDERFEQMVQGDRFAEWAWVHGRRYGTSMEGVRASLAAGRDLIFDIDWQGGLQLKRRFPDETVMIYILPPSMEQLSRRLHGRKTDALEVVQQRLANAVEELEHYTEYDYLLVNDDLERAYTAFAAIYRAARFVRGRQAHRATALLAEAKAGALPPGGADEGR